MEVENSEGRGQRVRKPTEMGAQYRAQLEAAKARAAALKAKKERTAAEQHELDDLISKISSMSIGGRKRKQTKKHKKRARKTRKH